MATFTRWVLGHKLLVVAFWIVVVVVGAATVPQIVKALSIQFNAPGEEGYETNLAILRTYGFDGSSSPIVLVTTLPAGTTVDTPSVRAQFDTVLSRAAAVAPGARTLSYYTTGNRGFVSQNGRTTYGLIFLPAGLKAGTFGGNGPTVQAVQQTVREAQVAGAPVHVTGIDALQASEGSGGGHGILVETLVAGVGALIVLAFVFGSFIAIIPLLMSLPAIMGTFLLVWGLTTFTSITLIVEFLISLIGLGVAIDYSLLIIVRWREERASGCDNATAIVRAMVTAGHAVIFSGTAVAIGLLAMVVLPIPALRSIGYGGMLIPLVSVAVAWTLLPVVLATIGPHLDWPHFRSEAHISHLWSGWARLVVRRHWIAAAVAVAILVALLIPATQIHVGNPVANSLAQSGDAREGLVALEQSGIGAGPLTPIELLVKQGSTDAVAARAAGVNGVRMVLAPNDAAWRRDGTGLVTVIPTTDANSGAGQATLSRVRQSAHAGPAQVGVGGNAAASADFTSAVYGRFPLMIVVLALIMFVLLARAFRSLVLPIKAIVLNILSIGAAWGIMTLVFQYGYGSKQIWGITATGAVTSWVPFMVFAFLFGLSMDYEVFIMSRMREEYDRTHSTSEAVIEGLGRTGRLVTGGALILFLSFISLSNIPSNDVKVMAVGLAAGILLDATVVRALLVPAAVSLMGHWNWWLPAWPARLLRVKPSLPMPEPSSD